MTTMSFAGVTRKSVQLIVLIAGVTLGASAVGGRGSKLPEILSDHPTKPYDVVANVDTSAITTDPDEMTEKKALPWIRKQAAEAHADAVIDLTREVHVGGKLLSTAHFGNADWTPPPASATANDVKASGEAVSATIPTSVVYRASAIKYQP